MKSNLHLLKNSFLALLVSLIILGCMSRKSQVHIEEKKTEKVDEINNTIKTDTTTETKVSETKDNDEKGKSEEKKDQVTKETDFSVTIEPDADGWSVYEFALGDKIIKGTTKGRTIITNKTKSDSISEVRNVEKQTKYVIKKDSVFNQTKKEDNKINEKHIIKTEDKKKDKETEKKEPIAMIVFSVIGVLGFFTILYIFLKKWKIL